MYLETNLARPLDSFPDAEVAEDPGDTEGYNQINPQTSGLINLATQGPRFYHHKYLNICIYINVYLNCLRGKKYDENL